MRLSWQQTLNSSALLAEAHRGISFIFTLLRYRLLLWAHPCSLPWLPPGPDQCLSRNLDFSAAKAPVLRISLPSLSSRTALAEGVPRAPQAAAALPGIFFLKGFHPSTLSSPCGPQACAQPPASLKPASASPASCQPQVTRGERALPSS